MITVFENAQVFDGVGAEPVLGRVVVEGDRIVEVGGPQPRTDTPSRSTPAAARSCPG
jgi:hypothetical protein